MLMATPSYQPSHPYSLFTHPRHHPPSISLLQRGDTAIMLAARYGYLKIVECLRKAGAKIDHEDMVSGVRRWLNGIVEFDKWV